MADFEEEEDLIIDEKKDPDIPIKLKLSIGGQRSRPPTSPKKSLKAVIRNRSKAMEDFDMTKVHQDDDYIYPSLELSDDEMEVGSSVHIGTYIYTGCPTWIDTKVKSKIPPVMMSPKI